MVVALSVAVGLSTGGATEPIELVDQTGRTVRIEEPVERLASVYGSGTYYVYALGVQARLVAGWYLGVKGLAQATEAMHRLEPRLAELLLFGDPNVEELVSRGVDLVMVDGSRHAALADQMGELGVPVLQYRVETPGALLEAMRLTGAALGPDATARAEAFIADYEQVVARVTEVLAGVPEDERARVLFLGTDASKVASGAMYQSLLIEAAGGVSVTEGLVGYWNEVGLEQILLWNPDVILIPPYGPLQPDDLLASADWAAIGAVRDGRVHRLPRLIAPMDAPVPESLLGVLWIAETLYPDLVDLDLAEEAVRFYATYYDYDLTGAELERLTSR